MVTEPQLDPKSLVARIISELEANPEARQLLLRALLTDEFLAMPARVDRMQEQIDRIQEDVDQIKTDMGRLKGDSLENRLHRVISGMVSQPLGLRRPRTMQSPLAPRPPEFDDTIENALDVALISYDEYIRILRTDFIIRARRHGGDQGAVWVVVEVSNRVGESDIRRARHSADILAVVFQAETIPVVSGYSIDPRDLARADSQGVRYLGVDEEF